MEEANGFFKIGESIYTSEKALNNLKNYRYCGVDKSYISKYFLQPYWNWAVQLFPLWLAPNLITLLGLFIVLANLAYVILFISDLETEVDRWVYFSFAIGLWLYSTFDSVDGKQARRTGTSSPLGELFDHGCDSLHCSFGALVQAAAMGLGQTWYSVFMVAMTTIPFYLSTWEEYHTGVLYLGYINGPTEGLISACLVMTLSGIFGPKIWTSQIHQLLDPLVPSFIPENWLVIDVMVASFTILVIFVHSPFCILAVYQACQQKGKSFTRALLQLIPMTLFISSCYLWLASPYSTVLNNHLILFVLTAGVAFGRLATKIILAYVTQMPFPIFTMLIFPLLIGAIITNIPYYLEREPIFTPQSEFYYLCGCFVYVVIAYFHWAFHVINKFCSHLGIMCFRIPRKKSE